MLLLLNNGCVVRNLQGLQTVFSAMTVLRAETLFSFIVVLVAEFGMLSCMLVAILILFQTGIQLWECC
jgi:hypothetical protein